MWWRHLCSRALFDEVAEDILKAIIHVKWRLIGYLGVDQTLIQGHGDLVGLLAERRSHAPDLVPVKVDGGDLRGITSVGDLVSLAVESPKR